jgi:signal transduction histidine kinase
VISLSHGLRLQLELVRQIRRVRSKPVAEDRPGWSLVGTHDLVELCRLLHERVSRQLDATIFFLGLYDQASQTVEVVWQVENGEELSGGSFPLGRGLTSQVILSGSPRIIKHWSKEGPRVQVQYATGTPGLPESAIAVPLKVADQTIGLVCVQSYRENAYNDADVKLVEALANDAAVVIAGLNYSEPLGAQVRRRVSELEAILANMADALLIIDSRGSLVRLNHAARSLLCLDEASIVLGQPFEAEQWDNWPPAGRAVAQALRPIVEQLHGTHEPREIEVELRGALRRIFSFRATPLHDADGTFTGGVIVFRDVTGEREVERIKDEMFSIASHDLKTPATVIKVQAQRLKRRFDSGSAEQDDVDEGLTMIADQADRLSKLLNLLLDLSRIESGNLDLDRAPTDLRGILINIARAVQSTTDIHQIEIDAPMGVIGHWDARRIEEVVQNLLNNAVKYSPNGGRIQVRLIADDQNAMVTIRDSGIGLDRDEVPHLFERFFRGRQTRRLEGAGLGLYICQAIIAAHGGRLWAESDGPNQGSSFSFSVPLKPPVAPNVYAPSAASVEQ